ncbi:MAG: hypothetical protein HYV75_00980 [Opitutae bacterium]|nr:hypothetical protein [Opitutae bacterium]
MLTPLLRWLDAPSWPYRLPAWAAFALCLLFAALPRRSAGLGRHGHSPAIFAALLFGLLLSFRWPGLAADVQWLNPDESQMLSGAITYRHFGSLWGHVDGMSSGPLVSLPLVVPALLGLPIDYTTGRFMGLVLEWCTLVFLWLTLRHALGDRTARLLILPAACVLAFSTYPEFVQYSSEQAPLAYCTLALWLVVTAFTAGGKIASSARLAGAGVVLGLLVVAKLQLLPLGAVLGVTALTWCLVPGAGDRDARVRAAACLLGGLAAAWTGLLLSLWWSGELRDFWLTHLLSNFHYSLQRDYPWSSFPGALFLLGEQDPAFVAFAGPALLLLGGMGAWALLGPEVRRLAVLAAALFVASVYAVIAPGRLFPHYLLITVPFAALLLACLYGGLMHATRLSRGVRAVLAGIFLAAGIVPQVWTRVTAPNPLVGRGHHARGLVRHELAEFVRGFARPGDTMAIWGWMPRHYVETGLPQATREAHTQRDITPHFLGTYLLHRYLDDLRRNRPAVFLDAVGPCRFIYQDRATQAHEIHPALRQFIVENYNQVAELEGTRVYFRRDRLPSGPTGP